jgi:hypothetical protein
VQKKEGKRKKENFEGEEFRASVEERWATAGCRPALAVRPAVACQLRPQSDRLWAVPPFFSNFLTFFNYFFGVMRNEPGIFGKWVYSTPIF